MSATDWAIERSINTTEELSGHVASALERVGLFCNHGGTIRVHPEFEMAIARLRSSTQAKS